MKHPLHLHTFQIGSPRKQGEGLRIGVTRRPHAESREPDGSVTATSINGFHWSLRVQRCSSEHAAGISSSHRCGADSSRPIVENFTGRQQSTRWRYWQLWRSGRRLRSGAFVRRSRCATDRSCAKRLHGPPFGNHSLRTSIVARWWCAPEFADAIVQNTDHRKTVTGSCRGIVAGWSDHRELVQAPSRGRRREEAEGGLDRLAD